jgi:hypothetical protein
LNTKEAMNEQRTTINRNNSNDNDDNKINQSNGRTVQNTAPDNQKKNNSNQPHQKLHLSVTKIKFPQVGDLKVRGVIIVIVERNANTIK